MAASQQRCSICLGRFKDPKLIPCYHTFCYKCLEGHARMSLRKGIFNCPICMRSVVLPSEGVKAFQNNFYILTECEDRLDQGVSCSKHPGQYIQLVCQTCNVCMCLKCKAFDHDTHPSKELAKAAAEVKDNLKARQSLCDERMKNLIQLKQECEGAEKSLKEQEQSEIEAIEQQRSKLFKNLGMVAEEMKDKVKLAYKRVRNENKVVTNKVRDEIEFYSSIVKLIDEDSDIKIFEEGRELEQRISKATSPPSKVFLKNFGKKLYKPAGIEVIPLRALMGTWEDHELREQRPRRSRNRILIQEPEERERELQQQRERVLQNERETREKQERELREQRDRFVLIVFVCVMALVMAFVHFVLDVDLVHLALVMAFVHFVLDVDLVHLALELKLELENQNRKLKSWRSN